LEPQTPIDHNTVTYVSLQNNHLHKHTYLSKLVRTVFIKM